MTRRRILAGILSLVLSVSSVLAGSSPWHQSLCLANGGYWPERVQVLVTNSSAEPAAGEPLTLLLPSLAGVDVAALRICRADGVELLFDLRDRTGAAKRQGALAADDKFIVPVECLPQGSGSFFVYAGNRQAWPVPDFLPAKLADRVGSTSASLKPFVGEIERLELRSAAPMASSPSPAWRNEAIVRVRRFNTTPGSPALVRVNLRQALARLPGVPLKAEARAASSDGTELLSCRLAEGRELLFNASLAPMTEQFFRIGFSQAADSGAASSLENYRRLLRSEANLVSNAGLESTDGTPNPWVKPASGGPHKVSAGFSSDSRLGKRSLEMTVLDNGKADWVGWNSREIPVKPGATYLLSGWLRAVKLQSWAALHAHFHTASGALTASGAIVSTKPTASGDSDWINTIGFFQAPPDAASIQLHLTMNTQGTLRHEGILLAEVVDGELVTVHSATAKVAGENLQVWEVNPLVKVFPDTPPGTPTRDVHVELAGNEYQAVQLALRGSEIGTTHVRIEVSPLKGSKGGELPPVSIERVGFVPVDAASDYYTTDVPEWCRRVPHGAPSTDGWAGWWPDPLAPASELDLLPQQTQPLWLTVHAPKRASPGEYKAQLTLTSANKKMVKIPLSAKVLPFALPDQGKLRAIFDFRFGPGGGFGSGADSEVSRRNWLRFMAEHRLGIDGIQPPPEFHYKDGKVTMDAAAFDEMAHFCFDELGMNVAYTPQFFYMFGWAYPPKRLFGLEPFTPEWTAAFKQAYRLFSDHVRQKGWHDKFVYYISDEPHFQHDFVVEQMKKLCALIHEVDPDIPIYSSTWRHCPAWDNLLDLWGIGQYGCFPVDQMQRLQQAGKKMWFTCDGQMATDTPFLATERLLPYYCFKYGATGFEFWGLAWWTYNPWQTGWHQFIRQSDEGKKYYWIRYPDGDGFLAYPGKAIGIDGPVSTIRLEQVRQGLQDYEALTLLSQLAAKAAQSGRPLPAAERALTMARDLVTIPNAGGLRSTEILPDPDRVPAARRAINAALVQLISKKATR